MKKKNPIKENISVFIFSLLEMVLFPFMVVAVYALTIILRDRLDYVFKEYGRDETVKMLTFGGLAGIFRILVSRSHRSEEE